MDENGNYVYYVSTCPKVQKYEDVLQKTKVCKVGEVSVPSNHCCGVYFPADMDVSKETTRSLWNKVFNEYIQAIGGTYKRTACVYVYKRTKNDHMVLYPIDKDVPLGKDVRVEIRIASLSADGASMLYGFFFVFFFSGINPCDKKQKTKNKKKRFFV